MSAAFTGPSRGLGIELYRGSMAHLESVNRAGGINGRRIVIRAYDDRYDPTPAIRNTIRLVDDDDVLLLMNFVGTPTVTRVLPLLKSYQKRQVYLFFPFTGAQPHRQPPYVDSVFNLRASYREETQGLVDHLVRIGRTRVAVFYQADAYGRGGWEGVKDALARHGLTIVSEAHLSPRHGPVGKPETAGGHPQSRTPRRDRGYRRLRGVRGLDPGRARCRLDGPHRQRVVRRQRGDGGGSPSARPGQGRRLHAQPHRVASGPIP